MSALRVLFLALLAVPLIAPAVLAHHCTGPSTSTPILADPVAGTYIVLDVDAPWAGVYLEANAVAGLQRLDNGADDTCHGMVVPDTLLTLIF